MGTCMQLFCQFISTSIQMLLVFQHVNPFRSQNLRVIRPLVYVREKTTRAFAEKVVTTRLICLIPGSSHTTNQQLFEHMVPLHYVRYLVFTSNQGALPVIPENCPACFQMPKERMRIKRILSEYENIFPNIYSSLLAAMLPLISRTTVSKT